MTSRFRTLALAAAALTLPLLASEARAQTAGTDVAPTTVTAGPDSARVNTVVVPDSVRRTARLFGLKMTKPTKAGLLSALLPGAGQLYNGRWWKVPLAVGAVGGTVYGEIFYQQRYTEFSDGFNARTDGDPNTVDTGPRSSLIRSTDEVKRGVNIYRRQRDTFLAYIALAHAVQILDAVVDAHLRDFDISDDLSLQWEPSVLRMPTLAAAPGVSLTLTFK
ncbi:DUF5683 domain-containing protein [Hymenobacter canadensis]|uniref:DUF5683 domain-containing protein n=1 Tax=Hymenobacter canadensis TaxID=2999067 RepID=A0ABY7LI48_9BACT|nr:DUF5683 domain-containing protein [Hymenobacter canadensis]WBA40128.1 DUF5683 domain-containing protein [Hymenobacter canadensis]